MNNSELLELIGEIDNIETCQAIMLVHSSEFLYENINEFTHWDELRCHVKLQYGDKLNKVVGDDLKINWKQILWYFNELQDRED